MKTNYVPAIVMLLAGLIDCIIAIQNHMLFQEFLIQLIIVLIVFLIIGQVIRMILNHYVIIEEVKDENEEEQLEDVAAEAESLDGEQLQTTGEEATENEA